MPESLVAHLQVWGKGFRVSERSEEFQLLVPQATDLLTEAESLLPALDWSATLGALYKLDDDLRRKQFWLAVTASSVTVLLFEASKDRHKRRSVVAVAVTTSIDWRSVDLSWVVARAAFLARRYSRSLASVLEGAPDHLQQQLKDGAFLSQRTFDLRDESPDAEHDWDVVCRAIRRWRGIEAVATKHLLTLGANVLFGTSDELDKEAIAGVLDPARGEIIPLNNELSLWEQPKDVEEKPEAASSEKPLQRIDKTLREIRDEQREMRDRLEKHQHKTNSILQSTFDLVSSWYDVWLGRRR